MKNIITYLLFGYINLFISCNTTDPPVDDTQPGRRDYVWTVDTLLIPYSLVRRMWASGPNDVWAIAAAGDLDKTIFHYDGNSWTTDGIYRNVDPASIYGFSSNNIWLGGHQGEFWHYDGAAWTPFAELVAKEGTTITWENIWGDSPNNIYAVGAYEDENLLNNNGVIAHYDGNSWKLMNTKINSSLTKIYKDDNGTYFILGTLFRLIDTSKIFLYNQNNLNEIYSNIDTDSYRANIGLIGNYVLITYGKNIYMYVNNNFNLFYSVDNSQYSRSLSGRNLKDILLYMKDGIAHYNGEDIQYLFQHNNSNYRGTFSLVLKNEVFFPFYDLSNGKTYMYKGVLSNNK